MDQLTFYKGACLDAQTFYAAAYFDAQEAPDEPGTDTALRTFSMRDGWSRVDVTEHRIMDVAVANLSGMPEGFAVSERGFIFDFASATPRYDATALAPTPLKALAGAGRDLMVIGDHGTYLALAAASGLTVLTDRYEMGALDHNATIAEEDAYFANERYVLAAAQNDAGAIAVLELTGASILSETRVRRDLMIPQPLAGVAVDPQDGTFLWCGHNPRPGVYRQTADDRFMSLYTGPAGAHTLTDLVLHGEEIYLADTNLANGGLFVLTPEDDDGSLYEFNKVVLPPDIGDQPVWQVASCDDVLWVLRSKDILRMSDGIWQQFGL